MITQEDIKCATIAKRYAGALLELVEERSIDPSVENLLQDVSEALTTSQDLKNTLMHPAVDLNAKKELITELFAKDVDPKIFGFLNLLLEQNRIDILPSILNFYKDLKNQKEGILTLTITSAVEIPDEMKNVLVDKLQNKFSKRVLPQYVVDESIIAGLIIQSADNVIDESYKTKFENMQKHLI